MSQQKKEKNSAHINKMYYLISMHMEERLTTVVQTSYVSHWQNVQNSLLGQESRKHCKTNQYTPYELQAWSQWFCKLICRSAPNHIDMEHTIPTEDHWFNSNIQTQIDRTPQFKISRHSQCPCHNNAFNQSSRLVIRSYTTVLLNSIPLGSTLPLVLLPLIEDVLDDLFECCFPVLLEVPKLWYRIAATGVVLVKF